MTSPGDRPKFDPSLYSNLPVHASLLAAQKASKPGELLALCVRVSSVRSVAPIQLEDVDSYVKGIFLQDLTKGTAIDTVPTTDLDLCTVAEEFLFSGEVAVAYGRFLPAPLRLNGKETRQRFHLEALRPSDQIHDLLGAKPDEMEAARQKRKELTKTPNGFEAYLKKRLAEIHQVVETRMSGRFSLAIKLVILQALSDGGIGSGANQRISTYYLSTPGQGKGVLSRYAETLAPLYATTQPALMSVPGLAVRMEQRKDQGWVVTPGAIPKAYRGVLTSHDVHRLPEKDASAYHAIFMATAEEGMYTPAKAGHSPFILECALHLNGNHRHLIDGRPCPQGPRDRLADIGMALDLFSRMDVVASLCIGDEIRPLSENFAAQDLGKRMSREEVAAAIRELKLLVADARDSIKEVDLQPIQQELRVALRQIHRILMEESSRLSGAEETIMPPGAFLMRTARALRKLVIASARLDGRSVANLGDLETAKDLLRLKFEVIRWICGEDIEVVPQGSFSRMYDRAEDQAEERHQKILDTFGGFGPLTPDWIADELGVGRRTVIRDLMELGIHPEGGKYRIPLTLEYEKAKEEAAREKRKARGEEAGRFDFIQVSDEVEAEILSEEELAERLDPVLARKDRPVRFYDSLPRLGIELQQACKAMAKVDDVLTYGYVKLLLSYASTQVIDRYMELEAGVLTLVDQEELTLENDYSTQLNPVVRICTDPDWEYRAGLILAIFTSVPSLPDRMDLLEDTLKRQDLPLGIRRHFESALARRKYLDANYGKVRIKF